ncbi:hypothetical protein R1flu_019040 [Riccia fluitans]|uniref:Uncharacterized protein n=1 Tax=Riccia fluitans TaxID=41844 RepID=A0ABD1ZHI9_9MARC
MERQHGRKRTATTYKTVMKCTKTGANRNRELTQKEGMQKPHRNERTLCNGPAIINLRRHSRTNGIKGSGRGRIAASARRRAETMNTNHQNTRCASDVQNDSS